MKSSARNIQLEVQIASKICDDVRAAIRNAPVSNNKVELMQLARLSTRAQKALAPYLAEGHALSVAVCRASTATLVDGKAMSELVDLAKRGKSNTKVLEQLTEEPLPEKGDYEISPELFERRDYLLIVVDNEFDWKVLCEKLEVKTVVSPKVGNRTLPIKGVGRVIPASRLLKLLGVEL
jgi:hypothetical protein